ncbi:hypothetical protein [Aporhodopirellula aestuarii]|uniref:C2H2-type domain-containing protein n=1 Tax=Aporhodopirellula aestuarii TaxID=2950107 RepID=A0ABT0U3K1_9BACT|nr:hypothetical protein [Aporhodopirellula aestuarii]MCM2371033.1 hypothetical protein [Aporhodopirellula aestuarii]
MIHYTCDRCHRSIDTDEGPRYIVHIDVEVVAVEPDFDVEEEVVDYLSDLNEMLEQESMAAAICEKADEPLDYLHEALSRGDDIDHLDSAFAPSSPGGMLNENAEPIPPSFDLCPECYARYLKNPLGRERSLKLHFSNN